MMKYESSGKGTVFASGLNNPYGLAFDSSGYLYVSNTYAGTIEKFNSGGSKTNFASGLHNPWGLAFDNDNYLYAADTGYIRIMKFDSSGNGDIFTWGDSPVWVATEIPEPASVLLMIMGAVLIRKKR
jgi:glucose/arabinose dehydrogenase